MQPAPRRAVRGSREWTSGKSVVSRPWALLSQRGLGMPGSPPLPSTAPQACPCPPLPSARAGPNGRCLLPPLPGKPQITDSTGSEPQHVFIILPHRHSAGVSLVLAAIPGVREERKRGHMDVPVPLPPLPGWGGADGTALLSAHPLSPRQPFQGPVPALLPATHWGWELAAGQEAKRTVIAEKVPEPGFPRGLCPLVATEVAPREGVSLPAPKCGVCSHRSLGTVSP